MVQIVPRDTIAGRIGTGLGSGIRQGLERLAQQKMSELAQRQSQNRSAYGLEALGFTPQESSHIALLDPAIQKEVVRQKLLAPQQEAYGQALSALLGNGNQQQAAFGEAELPESNAELQTQGQMSQNKIVQSGEKQISKTNVPQKSEQLKGMPKTLARLNSEQATKLAQIGIQKQQFETKEANKEKSELRKEERQDQREIDKETLPVYHETIKEARSAKNNDDRAQRITQLNEKGDLGWAPWNSFIKTLSHGIFGVGIDLTHLMTADAQELDKLSSDFIKDAKGIFGGRITDADLAVFFKTIPVLQQSQEGRRRVIYNMGKFNDAAKVRNDVMNEIISENNGKRPRHLESLIEERAKPRLDKLAEELKQGSPSSKNQEPGLVKDWLLQYTAPVIKDLF